MKDYSEITKTRNLYILNERGGPCMVATKNADHMGGGPGQATLRKKSAAQNQNNFWKTA